MVTSHTIAIICAVSSKVDAVMFDFAELGAAGVLTIYLDDSAPIARFGTRWLCQNKFSKGLFASVRTTQAGIPHFCANDNTFAHSLLTSWAFSALQLTQLRQFTIATAVPIGNISLFHDWVPLEGVRSTGFYVYFLFLAVGNGGIVIFASYFIYRGIKFSGQAPPSSPGARARQGLEDSPSPL